MDVSEAARQGASIVDRLTATAPAPPSWLVLATGLAALAVVLVTPVWRVARNVVTIAHEGGHALVALLTGRQLRGITLHSDTSGVTVSRGKPRGLGMVLTLMAGYPAPSLVGVVFAGILAGGRVTLMLWVAIVALVLLITLIRNLYGVLSVVVTGGAVFAVSWYGSAVPQGAFAYAATWFLLLAGLRPVLELQRTRRRSPGSDADQLARLTHVPGFAWVLFFAAISLAALAFGASVLLRLAWLN